MSVAPCPAPIALVTVVALAGIFSACQRRGEPDAAEARRFEPTSLQRGVRGARADEGQPSPSRTVMIEARDYGFEPPVITARVGETIAVVLRNAGSHRHNLELSIEGRVHALTSDVPPGGTGRMIVSMPGAPGNYPFFCPVDSHHELGMRGMLHVSEHAPPPISSR